MYGLCLPVCKSIVMSKKSTVFRLASIVIFSLLSLNTFKISCLIFFQSGVVHMVMWQTVTNLKACVKSSNSTWKIDLTK